MRVAGLRRQEQEFILPAVQGQDERRKDLDIGAKADIAQNARFGDEVGSVTKRPAISYVNSSVEASAVTGTYRYYNQSAATEYLLHLNGLTLKVGEASPDTLHTFSASSGYRFTAVTYQDLCYLCTGKDNVMVTDGTAAWELGSCKAALSTTYGTVLSTCESAWDQEDASCIVGTGTGQVGTNSAKFTITSGGGGVLLATDVISSTDIKNCAYIHMWVKSSVALTTGQYKIYLDDDASCTDPELTLDIPAITETATWTHVTIDAGTTTDTDLESVISLGLYQVADVDTVLELDDIRFSNLEQGVYRYKIVYNRGADDIVSGAISNSVTVTATQNEIALSNIPLGDSLTTQRFIYRTLKDGSDWQLCATLDNNTATTHTDLLPDAELTNDDGADTVTDDVPKGRYLYIAQERLFITGDYDWPSHVYYSDQYLPHWFETGVADITTTRVVGHYDVISEDDNDLITGITNQLGITYIFKQNSIRPYYVKGTPDTWTLGDVVSPVGCPAGYSIAPTEYGIVYQGWDHMYLFNGSFSSPVIDEFVIGESILDSRIDSSFGYYHKNLYLFCFTDKNSGHSYHDRVLVYDMIRKEVSVDKGGAQTSGSGFVNVNCFTSFKGATEWGQLYAGDSNLGWLYQYDRATITTKVDTVAEFDEGTHSDTMAVGTENNPKLTKFVIDDMEKYTNDTLAHAGWVTSETTEKIPPNLGSGIDGAKTVDEDETLSAGDKNYTALTVDASMTLTINDTQTIYIRGDVVVNGDIEVKTGTFTINAVNITVGAAGSITTDTGGLTTESISGTIILRANDITVTSGGVIEEDITSTVSGRSLSSSGTFNSGSNSDTVDGDFDSFHGELNPSHISWTSIDTLAFDSTLVTKLKYRGNVWSAPEGGTATITFQVEETTWKQIATKTSTTGSGNGDSSGTSTTGWTATGIRWTSSGNDEPALHAASLRHYEMRIFGEPRVDYINSSGVTASATDIDDFEFATQCFSETETIKEGSYSLKLIVANGSITLNDYLDNTISSLDISNAKHDTILIDVRASRTYDTGSITTYAAGGGNYTTITSAGHGLTDNDYITISASTDSYYDGTWLISSKTTDTFKIEKTYSAKTGAGTWKYGYMMLGVSETTGGGFTNRGSSAGSGSDTGTFVPICPAVADTWETIALDLSQTADSTKNAVITVRLKFCDTTSYNEVFIDNIRTGLTDSNSATWTSPTYDIQAETMGSMYWNEDLNTLGGTYTNDIVLSTRTGAYLDSAGTAPSATDGGSTASWHATTLTNPAGSAIGSSGARYFQFKIVFSCDTGNVDDLGKYYPFIYTSAGYSIKATYYTVSTASETTVDFRYRTGWRNYGKPLNDKIYKKIVSMHEGDTGSFSIVVEADMENTQTHTFDIDLTEYRKRWESMMPSTIYGRELRLEYRKSDTEDFKAKSYGLQIELLPAL